MKNQQLDLFGHVLAAYHAADDGVLATQDLYDKVATAANIGDIDEKSPVGEDGEPRSIIKRKIRWYQQTLKQMGVLQRVEGERGLWRLAEPVKNEKDDLLKALPGVKLVAFSTDLGIAVWGRSADIFSGGWAEPITLHFSSLPYPLRRARKYGNPTAEEFPGFACELLEPIVRNLVPGGSIVLNLSNDIFEEGSPARSIYLEETIVALRRQLGLYLMDRLPWVNFAKPPGPTWWTCIQKIHLSSAWEPLLWFTNDPKACPVKNLRVLLPHTERHQKMIDAGGCQRTDNYGDGAYRLREHSFGQATEGRIPRNVILRGNACADTRLYRKKAKELGLKLHGAMQPTEIPDFFVRYLSQPGDLVVDGCAGTAKTGLAAERNGRRWVMGEWMLQYLRGGAELFRGFPGFCLHSAVSAVRG